MENNLKFRSWVIKAKGKLALEEINYIIGQLPSNYVIIKNLTAGIGPYEFKLINETYKTEHLENLPKTLGIDGAGVVYKVGKDLDSSLEGKRVSFMCNNQDPHQIRSFSEYSIVPFSTVVEIDNTIDINIATYLFGNPFTALGLYNQLLKKKEVQSIVLDTAASALGQMIYKLCLKNGIKVINIGRRQSHIEILDSISKGYNLNSSDENFVKDLQNAIAKTNPSMYISFLGGGFPAIVFNYMPKESSLVFLGNMNDELLSGFSTFNFIFENKTIYGYHVFPYIRELIQTNEIKKIAHEILKDEIFNTKISKSYEFTELETMIEDYVNDMSKGKLILKINS